MPMTRGSSTIFFCFVTANFFPVTRGFIIKNKLVESGQHRIPKEIVQLNAVKNGEDVSSFQRRALVGTTLASICSLVTVPNIAYAGLLDEYGTDPSSTKTTVKLVGAKGEAPSPKKEESTIPPNLRSNYYYPTNKKRYLPRIKKCNDAIPGAADSIGNEDWEAVNNFALKIADDTILPMKLYTSSLTGGGTNVKVTYTKTMMNDSLKFEKYQAALVKAIKKKDRTASSTALEGMATALADYRVTAGLTGPDGGGDIPSVDEIRRSACRVQGRTFEQKVKQRDARLASAESDAQTTASKKK